MLVSGPAALDAPPGVDIVRVESAEEMRRAVLDALSGTDVLIKAAAVADYRPRRTQEDKFKKEDGEVTLILERTTDILDEIGGKPDRPLMVGFAAETENLAAKAKDKLEKKNLDIIVANAVGEDGGAMGSDVSAAILIDRTGREFETGRMTKPALAEVILDRIRELLGKETGNVRNLGGRNR